MNNPVIAIQTALFTRDYNYRVAYVLRGCPPKNRPLNSDQNLDFLQNFSTKQG